MSNQEYFELFNMDVNRPYTNAQHHATQIHKFSLVEDQFVKYSYSTKQPESESRAIICDSTSK